MAENKKIFMKYILIKFLKVFEMTEKDFLRLKFKAFEGITFKSEHIKAVDCMLLAVNFENRSFQIIPFPSSDCMEPDPVWVHIDYCVRTIPKLRVNG